MRRFVCNGCGKVWYSAALQEAPCERCGGSLRETSEVAGRRGEDEGRRSEFPGGVAAGAVGGCGFVAAQPGGAARLREDAGGAVSARVPGEPVRASGRVTG